MHQNKPKGFACVSCSWAKPAKPHPFEFCEEGAKATTWEITSRRCSPDFFAEHTVRELGSWSDHALEESGRLTHPLRYDAASDKYVPVRWEDADRGNRLRTKQTRKEKRRLLQLRACFARSVLHVRALRPHVWQQQSA